MVSFPGFSLTWRVAFDQAADSLSLECLIGKMGTIPAFKDGCDHQGR